MEFSVVKPSPFGNKLHLSPKTKTENSGYRNINLNGSWLRLSPKRTRLNSISIPFSVNKNRKDNSEVPALDTIIRSLDNQEASLICCLLQRSQFACNPDTYESNGLSVDGFNCSLVEFLARKSDKLCAQVGGYKSHLGELPFFPENLPEPLTLPFPPPTYTEGVTLVPPWAYMDPPLHAAQVLHPAASLININKTIWKIYFDDLLPRIAKKGSDGNFGYSSAFKCAECDLHCLQGLSKRIHFGKFLAEAKFLENPGMYEPAIRAKDRDQLKELLTDEMLERSDLERAKKMAAIINEDGDGASPLYNIPSSLVAELYFTCIMPLTKEVEVQYLLKRLD